ncbi:MAG: ABC transporter permease [Haloferacaceae archaeon]
MLDLTRYEARRRVRGTLVLAVLLGLFGLLVVNVYPSIAESTAEIDALLDNFPESFREGFGIQSYATIEGFLSAELYQFIWVLLLGLFMTYSAAGTLASDVESGHVHLLLATPISRAQVVVEEYLSLFVPLVVLNLVMPLFVYGGTLAVDYPVDMLDLLAVHAMSVPYLLVCASIGLLLSASVNRADVAERVGIAVVFLLFVIETVTVGTDFEWLGSVSPTRYYDPTEILLEETYDLGGAVLLLVVAILLVLGSLVVFQRRDV